MFAAFFAANLHPNLLLRDIGVGGMTFAAVLAASPNPGSEPY
jgi:hypothetical protein